MLQKKNGRQAIRKIKQDVETVSSLLAKLAVRIKLLADETRLKILFCLRAQDMCVNDLCETIGSGQANVSKHLGLLYRAGVVAKNRHGNFIYYQVKDESIFGVCDCVCAGLQSASSESRELTRQIKQLHLV